MPTTPAKKSAPKRVAAPKTEDVAGTGLAYENHAVEVDVATNLAMDWLVREAFRSGRWAHAPVIIEDSTLPDEVKQVLLAAYRRASS